MPERKAYVNPSPGKQGLNVNDSPRTIKDFQGTIVTNMIPSMQGVKMQYGFTLFNEDSTKTGGITMLHGFNKSDGTKQIIFSNDDDYWYLGRDADTDTAWNTIGDMGTAVETPHAFTLNDLVVFGTGLAGNTPKKWDGSSFTDITTPANGTNDLHFYEFFQGQDLAALYGAGDPANPSRVYISDSNDPDVWSGGASGAVDIGKNDGYKITGLKANGKQLIIFKEKNRYYLSIFYESNIGAYKAKVEPYKGNSGGAAAHQTIEVLLNGDVVSLAQKGIGVQGLGLAQAADGSLLPRDYSRDMMPLFDNINWAYAYKAKGVQFDRKYFLAVPYGPNQTTNNYVFVYHQDEDGWSVIPDLSVACWLVYEDENGNDVLYHGDAEQPRIYKWDPNEFTFDGELIQGRFRTGKINLGSILDFDDFQVLGLEGEMNTGDELTLKVITDGIESSFTIDDSFIVNQSSGGAYIGGSFVAEEYLGGSTGEEERTRWVAFLLPDDLQRKAREIEIQIENENTGAYFSLNNISINEFDFDGILPWPENHIIVNQK